MEISFTQDAIEELLHNAMELYNDFFCKKTPLASIDMKWKLARLSAALACLTISTTDFIHVQVTKNHVAWISAIDR